MKLRRNNITKKIIITLLLILLMGCSVSFGVGFSKQITAWFYGIQVKINGSYIKLAHEPFIYDGCIYVPIRDVSNSLGLDIAWDDSTKTVNLTSNGTSYNAPNYNYNNPTYNNQNYNYPYVVVNKKSTSDIENELNRDYDEYTEGRDDLNFEYDLSKESSYIKVKMEGQNFKKYSTEWEKRDEDDFEEFVEGIAEMIANQLDDDVTIYVYDKSSNNVAKYEYDEDKNKFSTKYEYDDMDVDDVEDKLNDEYKEYTKGDHDLEFDYDLTEYTSKIRVEMEGENFDRTSSKWDDRDDSDFEDFIEDIAEEVNDVFDDKNVEIEIYDDDNDRTAEYFYDEDDDDFREIYEY